MSTWKVSEPWWDKKTTIKMAGMVSDFVLGSYVLCSKPNTKYDTPYYKGGELTGVWTL